MVDRVGDVQLVEKRVAILRDRSSEDHDLVDFTDTLEECVNTWALNDVDVVVLALDFHGYCEVRLVENLKKFVRNKQEVVFSSQTHLEAAVHECLIQIKH